MGYAILRPDRPNPFFTELLVAAKPKHACDFVIRAHVGDAQGVV